MRLIFQILAAALTLLLTACGGPSIRTGDSTPTIAHAKHGASAQGNEVAIYALGLIGTGYRFGGKNPEAGLDCSGMVSYIYRQATGLKIQGSAADIARDGREIDLEELQPGDLVFFNTQNRPYSHVGIYIGNSRFVHSPSTNGHVRIDQLTNRYYARHFEAARTLFE